MDKDILSYTITQYDEGAKIDSILKTKLNLSRRMITGLKKANGIFLNGSRALTNEKVTMGDVVSVNITKEESQDIEPQCMDIDIIFEDRDLLIVNKEPGVVVHPTKGHPQGTLSNGVMYHWRSRGESNIVRLVNRLDRDTSGLVMIAKNQFSHQAMAKQLDANQVNKIYMAAVHGSFEEDEGTIDLPIDRPSWESIKREVSESGQRAVTHYNVIERYDEGALLRIRLETGKTHQIRVHMSHLGHPIYGDTLYGDADDSMLIGRQALHAFKLEFIHPRTNERISVEAPILDDMKKLIEKLRG